MNLPVPNQSAAVAATARSEAEQRALDDALDRAVTAAVARGVPPTTVKAVRNDFRAFAEWCLAHGQPALPTTADALARYAAHLTTAPRRPQKGRTVQDTRPIGPAAIERRLSSIRRMHREAGVPAPDTDKPHQILTGYRHTLALAKSEQGRTRKASAAMPDQLRQMLGTLDRATFAGARDACVLLLGYATAARVSELSALDLADVEDLGDDGLDVTLYRRKIKEHTVSGVHYGANPATCPVRAWRAYRALLAAEGRTEGPAFVRVDRHGRLAPPMYRHGQPIGDPMGRMTADALADVVTRAADAAELTGQWSGHSLRRGFATASRRDGNEPEAIADHGGWRRGSRALLGYIDEADRRTVNPVAGL